MEHMKGMVGADLTRQRLAEHASPEDIAMIEKHGRFLAVRMDRGAGRVPRRRWCGRTAETKGVFFDRRMIEEFAEVQAPTHPLGDPGNDLRGEERVAAQFEEIVVDADRAAI